MAATPVIYCVKALQLITSHDMSGRFRQRSKRN